MSRAGGPTPAGTGVRPFGDGAFLYETTDVHAAHRLAEAVHRHRRSGRAPTGIEDVVVGLASVVVLLDLDDQGTDPERCQEWLSEVVAGQGTGANVDESQTGPTTRTLVLPTTFDGPDLDAVADAARCTTDRVVALLTSTELTVAFVGFAPGFPYLTGLPAELAAVERRPTPRSTVPAGSVAVAGGFASVYPRPTPGGWHLVGHTATELFDPVSPPYARVLPGDRVRFADAGRAAAPSRHRSGAVPERPPLAAHGARFVEVLEPGLLSLVEDGGRRSLAAQGIPRSGPCDPDTMRLANRLVGTRDRAAAIECTASGPTLRCTGDFHLAVVGSVADAVDVRVDGRPVGTDAVVPVRDGQTVAVGRVRVGLRVYLSVAGGFATPVTAGSRAADLLSGLGPGPLAAGDRLECGPPTAPPRGLLSRPTGALPDRGAPTILRIVPGPHGAGGGALQWLTATTWRVGGDSNRIGLRLADPSGRDPVTPGPVPSTGMVTGAVQVPPGGEPIILMPDHATVGGYPVVACVITADLPVLGQLAPGDPVGFAVVGHQTAGKARRSASEALGRQVTGWYPTRAGT